jgi:hypothetical protein
MVSWRTVRDYQERHQMSGMSAWPSHSDEDVWDIIAFVSKLPNMSEQDYGERRWRPLATRSIAMIVRQSTVLRDTAEAPFNA